MIFPSFTIRRQSSSAPSKIYPEALEAWVKFAYDMEEAKLKLLKRIQLERKKEGSMELGAIASK